MRHHNAMSIRQHVGGFIDFIRDRGVAGFAIGFILGGAAQMLVQSLRDDIVNPLLGFFLGPAQTLSSYSIGTFKVGDFIAASIYFLILCLFVYLIFKLLQLERLDKPR